MNVTIELRPETINALDALCRQTGGSREGVVLDLIEHALGIAAGEYCSMVPAERGFAPAIAEARSGAPGAANFWKV